MLILLVFKSVENSEIKGEEISLIIAWKGDLRAQKEGNSKRKIRQRVNQLTGKKIEDEGSKIEKRLFIIFNWG